MPSCTARTAITPPNIEKAESLAPAGPRPAASEALEKIATPGNSTCQAVADQLGLPLARTIKSLVLATDEVNEAGEIVKTQVWLLLLRGDHDMNEVKVGKVEGLANFRFASLAEIQDHFGCEPGYLGPLELAKTRETGGRSGSGRDGRLDLRRQ